MKKIVPVLIAIILIVVIGVVGFGGKIMDKYSYSKELADMDEYYGVSGNRLQSSCRMQRWNSRRFSKTTRFILI